MSYDEIAAAMGLPADDIIAWVGQPRPRIDQRHNDIHRYGGQVLARTADSSTVWWRIRSALARICSRVEARCCCMAARRSSIVETSAPTPSGVCVDGVIAPACERGVANAHRRGASLPGVFGGDVNGVIDCRR
jgi:hypothetical protein